MGSTPLLLDKLFTPYEDGVENSKDYRSFHSNQVRSEEVDLSQRHLVASYIKVDRTKVFSIEKYIYIPQFS